MVKYNSTTFLNGLCPPRTILNFVIALSVLAGVVFFPFNGTAQAAGVTYYIDCTGGNDSNSGTSTSQPWKSLAKANKASIAPGDSLLLKRGCAWTGPLEASWRGTQAQPILIGAYGSGELPKIHNSYSVNVRITGTYLIIENLHATYSTPPNPDPNCGNQPVGWKLGFDFTSGASYNTLRSSQATRNAIGVYLEDSSHHNKVHNNTITDNNVVWDHNAQGDLGAMGMSLHGNDHEIAYNFFQNNKALCSYTSTLESNSIEVYNAKRNSIHHNVAYGDRVFSEMGSSAGIRSEDNLFAYNLHATSLSAQAGDPNSKGARFIVTRGAGHPYGPVLRTRVYNNTVYYPGEDGSGITCENCAPDILTLKNNLIVVKQKAVFISPSGAAQYQPDESHNLYWTPNGGAFPSNFLQNLATDNTLVQANPEFVNPTTDRATADFRLKANSPAIDKGTSGSGIGTDLGGATVPQGAGVDLGAFEFAASNPSVPSSNPPNTYASDQFARNITDNWGSADSGGSYTLSGSVATYDVNGSAGTITIPAANQGRAAALKGVSAQDAEVRFRVKTDKLASGYGEYVYFIARGVSSNTEYRGQIRFSTSQTVHLMGVRIAGGAWANLGPEVRVAGLAHTANSYIWVRGQVVGANPTTLRIKAWADGQAEPSNWQFSVNDSAASLQTAGSVGLRANLPYSFGNGAVIFTFDDFLVSSASQSSGSGVEVSDPILPVPEPGAYTNFIPFTTRDAEFVNSDPPDF